MKQITSYSSVVMRLFKAFSTMIFAPFFSVYFLLDSYAEWGVLCYQEDKWPWQNKHSERLDDA